MIINGTDVSNGSNYWCHWETERVRKNESGMRQKQKMKYCKVCCHRTVCIWGRKEGWMCIDRCAWIQKVCDRMSEYVTNRTPCLTATLCTVWSLILFIKERKRRRKGSTWDMKKERLEERKLTVICQNRIKKKGWGVQSRGWSKDVRR